MTFNRNIAPACLPSSSSNNYDNVAVSVMEKMSLSLLCALYEYYTAIKLKPKILMFLGCGVRLGHTELRGQTA